MVGIMFDLTIAFDTVDKTFLANELKAVGNRRPINQRFVIFREYRIFRAKIEILLNIT